MTTSEADRRSAHRRVGTAAVLAFLALLLLGATHRPAQADPSAPVATPDPGVQAPYPGFRDHDGHGRPGPRDGFGGPDRDGDGGGGFDGGAPPGGAAPAPSSPAPSTGGSQT
jgi:hypothetical protein